MPHDETIERAEPELICWPLDHYYSPIANTRALSREPARSRVWPVDAPDNPGIDWRPGHQVALVLALAEQVDFPIPDGPTGDSRDYHADNTMFSRLDAWMLQAMLRYFRPRRIIEVGCGWSSLMTSRVNRECFDCSIDVTCIEPYPPDFIADGIEGITRLLVSPVEQVPVETFLELKDGDFLFIDTSHTVKTGGDVVFLLQEILPRLAAGVIVHIHDIFLPWDYPIEWVLSGRAWNEQYAVRAFLAFNAAFEILIGVGWLSQYRSDVLASVLPAYPETYKDGGGSLWVRRIHGTSTPSQARPDDVSQNAELRLRLDDALARYQHLRERKAVRVALQLAHLRRRLATTVHRR
ncbi:MAG TPA: class I SAM-dependent methyltransferase [Solirubrobacteraceae bacterium]|nr:class I SAM-dependent methyltransferase [Solirubrobacteraceae bacterium]